MKSRVALAVVAFCLAFLPSRAEEQSPPVVPAANAAPSPSAAPAEQPAAPHPWEQAQKVLDAATAALRNGGITGLLPHIGDLEAALEGADAAYAATDTGSGSITVLTNGPADTLFQLTAAAAASEKAGSATAGRGAVAVPNPYPVISFYLGTYYNEISRHDEAVRALDKGLALIAAHGSEFDIFLPSLTSERAVALARLQRFPEALAGYEAGLQLSGVSDLDKARMHRGRGYVLTELGRLDEAEEAYNESLKLEPGNRIALNELEYIKQLRAGGEKAPGGLIAPNNKPTAEQPATGG
jgi:tetratricopeptide (TPR) repeat protein